MRETSIVLAVAHSCSSNLPLKATDSISCSEIQGFETMIYRADRPAEQSLTFCFVFTCYRFRGSYHISTALPFSGLATSFSFLCVICCPSMGIPQVSKLVCPTTPPSKWQFNTVIYIEQCSWLYPACQITYENVGSVPVQGILSGSPACFFLAVKN